MDKDRLLVTKVPECMKNMQVELVSEWDHFDMDRRKGLYEEYKKLGYREFAARHSRADMDLTRKTDAEIHKDNVRSAESLVVDLYVRINAVTGDVTDWSGIYYGGKALNGFVTGELGKVKVESIVAGGYNIQRKHVRVLVHEV